MITRKQAQIKKKISLPAALFNGIHLKNMQNSSFISNSSIQADPPCGNHPSKKGKYIVLSQQKQDQQQQIYYCQKCAILLASKGFQVKKLQSSDTKSKQIQKFYQRQQDLSHFLSNIQDQIHKLTQSKKLSSEQIKQLQDNFSNNTHKIDTFFLQLYTTLDKYKKKQIHDSTLTKKRSEKQLTSYLNYLSQKITLLQAMKSDINSSKQSIINDTPQQDYQLVMSHYQNNLTQIKIQPIILQPPSQNLPSIETLQCMLSELFNYGPSGTHFSFDSQLSQPFE